jgi:DnaK suppressor protein
MDTGAFGICERCGKKITVARLEALPFAALCIECKSREERRR